jgi:hypothetical protein
MQGTTKPGIKPEHHAIIYSSEIAPRELPGEQGLVRRPIRIEQLRPTDTLAPQSRLNYAKVYTVEHNIKVRFIGRIHRDSEHTFFTDFQRTIDKMSDVP